MLQGERGRVESRAAYSQIVRYKGHRYGGSDTAEGQANISLQWQASFMLHSSGNSEGM